MAIYRIFNFVIYRLLVLLFIFSIQVHLSIAQQLGNLSLNQALSLAYDKQPALQSTAIEQRIAEARAAEVRLKRRIQLSGSAEALISPLLPASVIPVGQFNPSNPTDEKVTVRFGTWWQGVFGITASKTLYDATISAQIREENFQARLAENKTQQTRQDIAVTLGQAWLGLLLAKEELAYTASALRRAEALAKEADIRYKNGANLLSDANTAQIELHAATIRYNQAVSDLKLSTQALAYRMGIPLEDAAGIVPADSLSGLLQRVLDKPFQVLDPALVEQQRPDAQAIVLDNALQALKMNSTTARLRPSVSLSAYLGANNLSNTVPLFKEDEWFANGNFGLKVVVPISELWQLKQRQVPIMLKQQQNAAQLNTLRQQIAYDYTSAQAAYELAAAKLPIHRSDIALARQNADLARERYTAGAVLASVVADAENTVRQQEFNYLQTAYDLLKAALDLGAATGEPAKGW